MSEQKKIEYLDQLELAIDYAKLKNKFLIYEYKDFYCQQTKYDNFGFFNCDNFDEFCDIVFDYMLSNKTSSSKIEIESYFEDKQLEFRVIETGDFIKIINFDENNSISFMCKDEIFIENITNISNDYKQKNTKKIKKYNCIHIT